jgi:hypothetical protein
MEASMKAWEHRKIPFADRVQMYTRADELSGCHIFIGRKDSYGYAQIKDCGKAVLLHRWIWERHNGAIPDGKHVLHKCDVRCCINPQHLFIGTHQDNMTDKKSKGRAALNIPRGEKHKRPMAKVTEAQVTEIKNLLKRGYRQADIARDFNVSRNLISEIRLGKTWTHVP